MENPEWDDVCGAWVMFEAFDNELHRYLFILDSRIAGNGHLPADFEVGINVFLGSLNGSDEGFFCIYL